VAALAGDLDGVALGVIKGDVSQFMQNFFNYNTLLFSFFASQTYSFLYQQQESLYLALYAEVTEARSLMEQLTLISQARPSYTAILGSMRDYVDELVLGMRLGCPPAVLLSSKPANDPLEKVLYLTSVGLPSVVYDTVRSLRQARGVRLGTTQQKLPKEHFVLLGVLGILELLAFPLLGAGISTYETAGEAAQVGHIIWVQSVVFAFLAGGVALTLQIVQDLRSPTAGLYSLDSVLEEMAVGLQAELDRRLASAPSGEELVRPSAAEPQDIPLSLPELGMGESLDGKGEGLPQIVDQWTSLQPTSEELSIPRKLLFCTFVGCLCALLFPPVVELLRSSFSGPALQAIREDNNAQWLQNFFGGIGLIFSLFTSQTFGFLYSQQEQIYLSLYAEVSEAKALLEQLTLVCRCRPLYGRMLKDLQRYVKEDLERVDCPPTELLGPRPMPDPLESVLYATSVGVPGAVYETVRGLRQARGARLGATQKKLPDAHFAILNIIGVLELSVFPVLAAGCAALDMPGNAELPGHVLSFQGVLFGVMAAAVALTLAVLWDLLSPVGETYNIRGILKEMVSGLEQELELRIACVEPQADPE